MPDQKDHFEELEKLVEENRRAFERAKRLLDEAKKKAAHEPSDRLPAEAENQAK